MNYGKVGEPSSSRSRCLSTERRAATSATLTVILSRSDRALNSNSVKARPERERDNHPPRLLREPELFRQTVMGSEANPDRPKFPALLRNRGTAPEPVSAACTLRRVLLFSLRHKHASPLARAPLDFGIGAVNSGSLWPENLLVN